MAAHYCETLACPHLVKPVLIPDGEQDATIAVSKWTSVLEWHQVTASNQYYAGVAINPLSCEQSVITLASSTATTGTWNSPSSVPNAQGLSGLSGSEEDRGNMIRCHSACIEIEQNGTMMNSGALYIVGRVLEGYDQWVGDDTLAIADVAGMPVVQRGRFAGALMACWAPHTQMPFVPAGARIGETTYFDRATPVKKALQCNSQYVLLGYNNTSAPPPLQVTVTINWEVRPTILMNTVFTTSARPPPTTVPALMYSAARETPAAAVDSGKTTMEAKAKSRTFGDVLFNDVIGGWEGVGKATQIAGTALMALL